MKEISYGIAPYRIRNYQTEILLIQAKGRNDWGFIKGKIENNETEKECAIRECKEEIGLNVNINHLEQMIWNVTKRKNIGIFLLDDYNYNINVNELKLCFREIKKVKFFKLNYDIIKIIQPNQKKIMMEILNIFMKRKYFFKER